MSNEIIAAFKQLSLHGMASAWPELLGTARMKALDHEAVQHQLIKAEKAQRDVRSLAYQMRVARFPAHRDLAGFDFKESGVDETLVRELHQMKFLEAANNIVFVGGPGTGKTHLATSMGDEAIRKHGKRVRFFSTVDLVNILEQEKAWARPGSWPISCSTWIWSSSMRWVTCRSPKAAGHCSSTFSRSSTKRPAW